jgi:hypothetical protein
MMGASIAYFYKVMLILRRKVPVMAISLEEHTRTFDIDIYCDKKIALAMAKN